MNALTSRQRKFVYLGLMIPLLAVVIWLGLPMQGSASGYVGVIAQQRIKHDLTESSLGEVDPASSAMSLVLLGLRGMAANVLWMNADHEKDTKQWSQLERTIESIILLQPHFQTVWKYQSWNLAYNVSNECDAVEDRFFWVKKGLRFLQRGVRRNAKVPELPHDTGDFCGKKVGRADERNFFRKFFVRDPDAEIYKGGPDPTINPDGADNYQRARDWYLLATDLVAAGAEQHKMDGPLFFAYPQRSLMDHANALREDAMAPNGPTDLDSVFSKARGLWEQAYNEWTRDFGRRTFTVPVFGKLQIDGTDEELARFAEEDGMTLEQKIRYRDNYQNTTGYRFWRLRCETEQTPEMADAHRLLILGRRKYSVDQEMNQAVALYDEGLAKMQSIVDRYRDQNGAAILFRDDHDLAEEGVKALLIWRAARDLAGRPVSDNESYPLKELWTNPEFESLRFDLFEKFQQWQGGQVE